MGELIITVKAANDEAAGFVKPNPAENITADADGTLHVGGRLGQMEGGTGIYAPATIKPNAVGNGSLLITEASGTTLGNKALAVSTGHSISLKAAAPAGSTEYRVKNTYANRIICAALAISGGVVALDEATASRTVAVTSVTIGGAAFDTPDSSADDNDNDIVITTAESVNPDDSNTKIRYYPTAAGFSTVYAGMAAGGASGYGASVVVGQKVFSKTGNACALVGADIWNAGNGNAVFGRQHISRRNRSLLAGTGHDTTNGPSESVAALGQWSEIRSTTAVGNGTNHTSRKNAFEITSDGGMVLTDPEGGRWKFTVNTSGVLSGTKLA